MADAQAMDDARLVEQGREGNHDAFARLVARYQSPLCALAYSACGNVARSQDLAQEAFIIAWRKLRDLKEPAKFKPWLFGIARNLNHNTFRQESRNPLTGAESLDDNCASTVATGNPAGQAMSKEEEGILWRSLEAIPESYREPLILFYREQQSVERVAAVLELSEETVRQRLSRGRKLLHEQVVAYVEGTLGRTAPGPLFTANVMSALSPLGLAAGTSSVGSTLLKGGAAGKAAAAGGTAGLLLGPVIGLVGLVGGTWAMTSKLPGSARERTFARKAWAGLWALTIFYVLGAGLVEYVGDHFWPGHPQTMTLLLLAATFAFVAVLFPYTFWMARVQRRIQKEEGKGVPVSGTFALGQSYEYRSQRTVLGMPLVHVRWNCLQDGKTLPAIGWIACGNRAYGILFASGLVAVGAVTMAPIAIGLLAVGGCGIGLLAFGGLAVGGWAMGGGAIGYLAYGGGALGWLAASGGATVARYYAQGGGAIARHANDHAAGIFMQQHVFFRDSGNIFTVFITLSFLPLVLQVIFKIRGDRRARAARVGVGG